MTDYDVIVVGCGPTGLMCAGELAARGVNVLGVDKKPHLDKNIRTASGYSFFDQTFNHEYIRREPAGDKTLLHYEKNGFTIEYPGTLQGVYSTHMFSDTGRHWQASTRKKPLFSLFVPTRWLAGLYARAQNNGASFLTGTLALKVNQSAAGVEVLVRTDGKNSTLTCKKLIAADGLSSRVATYMGANKNRTVFGKGPTVEYEVTDVDCPYERGDMFFFGGKNFGGRQGGLIMIPSPNGNNAFRMETISGLPAGNSTELIDFFIASGPFAHWFKNITVIDRSGALVELMTPMTTPYMGNVLFAGDTAAFGECLYQSATMSGYRAACCAEMELKGKKGYKEYTQWWGDHFEWVRNPKRMADYVKRTLFQRFFSVKELDFLFDLSEKNPIVIDEAEASPYDFFSMIVQQFVAMPEVPDDLKRRMQEIDEADMSKIAGVIGKKQKE